MKLPLKQFGRLLTAAFSAVAIWSLGSLWIGAQQQASAAAVNLIDPSNPGSPGDSYLVTYFDVSTGFTASKGGYGGSGQSGGAGDALLRIVDAGNSAFGVGTNDVCANIYVFNDVQEMEECCACPLSSNSLTTLSVINNLTSNPFHPTEPLGAGVIKIVGSNYSAGCSTGAGTTTAASPGALAEGLHAWINHTETMASNQASFKPAWGFTTSTSVEELANAALDSGELNYLTADCRTIAAYNTSGVSQGICSCAQETPGPTPTPAPTPTPIPVVTSSGGDNSSDGAADVGVHTPVDGVVGHFQFATVVLQTGGLGGGNHAADLTVSPPAGWTLVLHTATPGTDIQLNTYWEVNPSPGELVTWDFSGGTTNSIVLAAVCISDISGVDTASPIEDSNGAQNAPSTSIFAPSVTTTVANSLIIGAFGITGANTISPPSEMTHVCGHNPSSGPSVETAYKIQAAIGASGSDTATAANAGINIGQLIAVAPAP